MPGRAYTTLFDLATAQRGYVTQEQARRQGLTRFALRDMADRGQVERVAHGLYRFTSFPRGALDSLMEAVLWPRGARGVLSHETALDLYDLSDANPAKIHLTLPPHHRINRRVPDVYELHFEPLSQRDVTYRESLPITTVERTIRDCHRTHLRRGLLDQAIDQARARGLITRNVEQELRDEIERPKEAAKPT